MCAALRDPLKIRPGPRSGKAKSASPTNSFNEFLPWSNEGEKSANENTANTCPKYQLRRRTCQISPFYHSTTSIIRQRSIIWSFDNDMTSPSTSPVLYSFNVCTKKVGRFQVVQANVMVKLVACVPPLSVYYCYTIDRTLFIKSYFLKVQYYNFWELTAGNWESQQLLIRFRMKTPAKLFQQGPTASPPLGF